MIIESFPENISFTKSNLSWNQSGLCRTSRRIFIDEERRVQRKTIRPIEYLEVELYVGHSWFVCGTAHQALDEIAKYYAQFTKKIPTHHYNIPKLENPQAYGMQLMQGTRDEPLNRVKMQQEASEVGFRLLCRNKFVENYFFCRKLRHFRGSFFSQCFLSTSSHYSLSR